MLTTCGAIHFQHGAPGKLFLILLDGGDQLMIHLRMTGRLLRILVSLPEEKHKHLIFQRNHEKGIALLRYPPFWAVLDPYTELEKLGKEPFDLVFSAEYLNAGLKKRKKQLKNVC